MRNINIMIQSCIKDHVFVFNLYALCLRVVQYRLSNEETKSGIYIYLSFFSLIIFRLYSTILIDNTYKRYAYFSVLFVLNVL